MHHSNLAPCAEAFNLVHDTTACETVSRSFSGGPPPMHIRPATEEDWPRLWPIVRQVAADGETYPYAMDLTEADGHRFWMELPCATYLAEDDDGAVLGSYYLKPNQPTLGDHVANAGYMVAEQCRGVGVGRALCEHSLAEAPRLGFLALQFNLVVETNPYAIALYEKLGFEIKARLPRAFRRKNREFVDAFVMYRWL
jgi:ribosomal protein S18 acetylase RimI-like enzyme